MTASDTPSRVLAVDSGSPVVSVAFGGPGGVLSSRSMAIAHSSEELLRGLRDVLAEAGAGVGDVEALLGLRGPGSFTGLRVGLATLLGLHQALGVPATTVSTLEVLGFAAAPGPQPVAAVVDALRGEWFVQCFEDGEPLAPPSILGPTALVELGAARVIGHGAEALRHHLPSDIEVMQAPDLAPAALGLLARRTLDWSPATLLDPLYLRPPAIHGRG